MKKTANILDKTSWSGTSAVKMIKVLSDKRIEMHRTVTTSASGGLLLGLLLGLPGKGGGSVL